MALTILSGLIGILALMQGWQMFKHKNNPNSTSKIASRLDIIINQLGKMEQRLNDIWDKVKED